MHGLFAELPRVGSRAWCGPGRTCRGLNGCHATNPDAPRLRAGGHQEHHTPMNRSALEQLVSVRYITGSNLFMSSVKYGRCSLSVRWDIVVRGRDVGGKLPRTPLIFLTRATTMPSVCPGCEVKHESRRRFESPGYVSSQMVREGTEWYPTRRLGDFADATVHIYPPHSLPTTSTSSLR